MRRLRMPRLYDLTWEKPPPLVERYLRLEVDERIDAAARSCGRSIPADVERAVVACSPEGRRGDRGLSAELLRESGPRAALRADRSSAGAAACRSRQLRGAAGDQGVRADLDHGHQRLRHADRRPLPGALAAAASAHRHARRRCLIMQSNGGLMTRAAAAAGRCTSSNRVRPAASSAPRRSRRAIGCPKVITFDMGGTTAKAVDHRGGRGHPRRRVPGGRRHHAGSRLLTGAATCSGCRRSTSPRSAPAAARSCGSTPAARCRSGPQSAGACPGRSATTSAASEPTVTDANLILGYLNPG